ncbi:GGDEF domain-containing protein [Myxococcota bacterium]|nr:GGDEF domain-containing protein [Myxococcota bacterium]MBU1382179.1 GGDEF domain-containing protein [Myxococcota bacterium]MBU1498731.1 GGDEF domain-containing protein [Myxococcota bacterium]
MNLNSFKWLGYFFLLSGMGIVTLSMGWIAGFHGLGTLMTVSLIPLLLAVLISFFVINIQENDLKKRDLERNLNMRTIQLQEANQIIRRISTKDRLTGLYNRRGLRELLKREILRCERLKTSLVVLAITFDEGRDKDNIKRYSMMSVLGKKLSNYIRSTDVFARVSEDTLAILLLDTGVDGTKIFLDRLYEQLNQSSFRFPVFRAGLAIFPTHSPNPDDLINMAMHTAKQTNPGDMGISDGFIPDNVHSGID